MEATVREGQAPAVVVALQPGERLTAEAGAMMFVSGDIAMEVEMPGGLAGGLKRKLLAGESLFLTRYEAKGSGAVGITGPFPGSIRQHELDGEIICEKHAYLGHVGDVEIESALAQRLGMGIRGGGEGFFLQRLRGKGTVWLQRSRESNATPSPQSVMAGEPSTRIARDTRRLVCADDSTVSVACRGARSIDVDGGCRAPHSCSVPIVSCKG